MMHLMNVYQQKIAKVTRFGLFSFWVWNWDIESNSMFWITIFFILVDRSTKTPPIHCDYDSRSNNYKVCCEKKGKPLPKPDPIKRFMFPLLAHFCLIQKLSLTFQQLFMLRHSFSLSKNFGVESHSLWLYHRQCILWFYESCLYENVQYLWKWGNLIPPKLFWHWIQ